RARTPRRPSRTGSRTARAAARPPGRSARSRTGRWGRSLRAPRLTAPARHAAPAARTRRNDERSGASCLRSPREECRAACNICAQGSLDTRAHDASHGSDARRVRCVGHVTHPDGPGMFLASPPLRMNGGSAMPSTPMSPIRVGVAGWDYADWNGVVYPQPKPRGFDPVRYLAGYIDLIEISSTFYRPPRSAVAEKWAARVRDLDHFRYTAKLWRRFTHERTEAWTHGEVRSVRNGFHPLHQAGKLGAVLIQFPWSFKNDDAN